MTYICTIPGQKSWMLHLYRGTTLCQLGAYIISIPVIERTYDLVLIYFWKKNHSLIGYIFGLSFNILYKTNNTQPDIGLSMFILPFIIVIVCCLFELKRIYVGLFKSFVYICIAILTLEIQLSRGECWDPINRFNSSTFLFLSQTRTVFPTSNVEGIFCVQWVKVRDDCSFCLILVELLTITV